MNTMKYKKDQLKAYRNTANTLLLEQICHLCCGKFSKTLAISTIAKILSWVVHTTTMLDSFLVLMFVYILGSIYQTITPLARLQIRLIVCSIRISHSCSYLTFDVLSGREAGYFCNIYGHDLWVLVMDLNKKICFKCPVNEIIMMKPKMKKQQMLTSFGNPLSIT